MRRTGYGTAFLLGLLVVAAPTAESAASELPAVVHLVVHIDDRVNVPSYDLQIAKNEVDNVFRAAGVAITWTERRVVSKLGELNDADAESRQVTLMLVNVQSAARCAPACILGLPVGPRGTAFIFLNRIQETAKTKPIDVGVILGRVMAHEVGHLLLPLDLHSGHGIGRDELDFVLADAALFTEDEARTIRAGLLTRVRQE